MAQQNSGDVAKELAVRVYQAEHEDKPITVQEFRHLFLKGLAALVREADSISYRLKQR
jgi:hypothetical protein